MKEKKDEKKYKGFDDSNLANEIEKIRQHVEKTREAKKNGTYKPPTEKEMEELTAKLRSFQIK